jgi:ATP adenylyltransferase
MAINTASPLIERNELVRLCDEKIDEYLQKRGTAVYDHRRAAIGYLSGSLRYEVLKRAGFRCELCGISADERAIEVDHILPRKHGGLDELTNLQALCFKCNANKGARDDKDFRAVREGLTARQPHCIFCELQPRYSLEQSRLCNSRQLSSDAPSHTGDIETARRNFLRSV